jgi:hypothetical protein
MQKKYTAMLRKSKLEYVAVCLELNFSARGVELAAVEKNLASAIELYLQDIVENKLPGAIISEPKINIEYGMMDSMFLCYISLRGADILSVRRFELIQLTERGVYQPRVNYNILPEDCLFRPEMGLRSGQSVTSFGSVTNFVRVRHPLRSGQSVSSFGSFTLFVRGLFLLLFGDMNRRYGRFALLYRGFTVMSFPFSILTFGESFSIENFNIFLPHFF